MDDRSTGDGAPRMGGGVAPAFEDMSTADSGVFWLLFPVVLCLVLFVVVVYIW